MFSSMLSLLGSLRRGNFVTNSLRFRSSAPAFLSRTFATPTSSTVFTWSGWVKRGALGVTARLLGASTTTNFGFNSSDQLLLTLNGTAAVTTTAVYRDPSAWYHIVYAQNGAAQTIYVNGSSAGTGATANTVFNTAIAHQLGAANTTNYFDGYLTEVNFIDGQALTPSSFGQIESTTGVWSPKQYVGTYGTNGFYLKFGNTSSVAALGNDSSGNNNTWTVNNVSLTAGLSYDSMLDVPANYSDGGNGRGNYAVLNPLARSTFAANSSNPARGNLAIYNATTTAWAEIIATLGVSSGKWYWEILASNITTNSDLILGVVSDQEFSNLNSSNKYVGSNAFGYGYYSATGNKYNNAIGAAYGAAYSDLNVIGVALDMDAGTLTFYKNNVSQGVAFSGLTGLIYPAFSSMSGVGDVNFGQRPFSYTPPAGFRALNTNNLPTPTIANGANFMAATTYTGTAGVQSILNAVNNVSFQPDLVWIKSRTPGATSHALFDSTRGATKYLSSNTTTGETTLAQSLTAFGANGFSLGTDTTIVNANANSYIAWQWRESIIAGLDVVSYAGTGVNRTVAHNLGVAPAMIIVKRSQTGATSNWQVRHTSIAAANSIQLNLSNQAAAATTVWASTAPTSSVFTVGTSADVNASGISYVAYCFAEIAGFSRFGSYTGNGSADGPFVFCGFRPRWVMYKSTTEATGWAIIDTSMNTSNVANKYLNPNDPTTEGTFDLIDVLSNGFKFRTIAGGNNASGQTYIFAAFAEVPTKYALAR